MRLTLITVNYNGSEDLIRLLKSLRSNPDQDFEIIAVDNASDGDNRRKISDWVDNNYPKVQILWSRENLGFAGANNLAVKQALQNGSDWILFINPDTWAENDFIEHLRLVLSHSEGLLGIAIKEGDKTVYKGIVEWLKPTLRHENDKNATGGNYYVIGAAMLVQRSVFGKIGFMDEKYFLYFEDADYSLMAQKAGIPIKFVDEIKINHEPSSLTKKLGSPLLLRYHYRNALYFNRKHYNKFLTYLWALWILKKQLWKILFFINPEYSRQILLGVIDFYLNRMGKIK